MPADIAKLHYITSVESLLPQSTASGRKPEKGSIGGPVVSSMAEELEDKDAPVRTLAVTTSTHVAPACSPCGYGHRGSVQGWDSLQIRASEGDSAAILTLLDNGASVDERDSEGCAALHWAADRGCTEASLLASHKLAWAMWASPNTMSLHRCNPKGVTHDAGCRAASQQRGRPKRTGF